MRRQSRTQDTAQRLIDVCVAAVLLVLTSPLPLEVAALVAVALGRPVIVSSKTEC